MSKIKYYNNQPIPETTYADESIHYYSYLMTCYIDEIVFALDVSKKDAKSLILQAMALFNLDIINASELIIQCKGVK